jgi:MFS family permease
MAEFMVVLDATIVNVALPSIQQDLEMSDADLQWVVNAYTLVFGGFLLLGGRVTSSGASGCSSSVSRSSRRRRCSTASRRHPRPSSCFGVSRGSAPR